MQGSNNAKALRRKLTEAERDLWYQLRDRRLGGYKFRRQVPIGPYVADFVCMSARLIVELDGGQHAEQLDYDLERTAYLHSEGHEVLRFWNNDVITNMEGVLNTLTLALSLRERGENKPLSTPANIQVQVGNEHTAKLGETSEKKHNEEF